MRLPIDAYYFVKPRGHRMEEHFRAHVLAIFFIWLDALQQ